MEREEFNACSWLIDRQLDEGKGDHVAIISQGQSYTYNDVYELVVQVAASLRAIGVRPEERVAMAMLDSVEFVAIFCGAMRIGAVPVAINPLLPGRDLAVITADSRARIAAVSAPQADRIDDLLAGSPELEHVIVAGSGPAASSSIMQWEAFVAAGRSKSDNPYPTWFESPGFWLCTSGSTGQPKLAMHRHGDIKITCETYAKQVLQATANDLFFSVGPMFHAYGLGNSLTFPFAVGATVILEPTRPPTPRLVADLVSTHKVTLFFCIPTFYAALNAADLPEDTFSSVRYGISAAEPLPAETFERFRHHYGVDILDGIGSTELLHIYLSNSEAKLQPGTSGVVVPGYEVKIVDERGTEQPPGEPGQLLAKGDSLATGYWCQNDINRRTFDGPWMRTGDLYVADDQGFHTYLGRVDDMLRVGGEWVSPAEVEGVLIEHPSVLEAAIVGETDAEGALRPVAYVVTQSSEATKGLPAELTEFCRGRLAGFKRPRRYKMVNELPKTATGKIQRFKLRS